MTISLCDWAVEILSTAAPSDKVAKTGIAAAAWRAGALPVGSAVPPQQPARPAKPELCDPRNMPKRSAGPKGRVALVHAIAHIELSAIDLAWDIIARFTAADLPRGYYDDWVDVAVEESQHYAALAARLTELGAAYGDLPAHAGLWDAAERSARDLATRLVAIPLTLEARGLDTTPQISTRLRLSGDEATAAILDVIYADEIKHLAVGVRWFEFLCAREKRAPIATYHAIMAEQFPKGLKGPFNMPARTQAGMGEDYLKPWIAA